MGLVGEFFENNDYNEALEALLKLLMSAKTLNI
jgi:hypothetical protein